MKTMKTLKIWKIQKVSKLKYSKTNHFEFSGLHIWIQRTVLHRIAWSKIAFRHVQNIDLDFMCRKSCVRKNVGDLLPIWSIQKLSEVCGNFWNYQIYKRLLKYFSNTRFVCSHSRRKQGANPIRLFFEKCFKCCVDSGFRI